MKTMKEFPATHSMSTEWFVVDEEGNIALFDFDENGPVPVDIPVESSSCLMTSEEDFGEKDSDEIVTAYTEGFDNPTITWESSNTNIFTVTGDGNKATLKYFH